MERTTGPGPAPLRGEIKTARWSEVPALRVSKVTSSRELDSLQSAMMAAIGEARVCAVESGEEIFSLAVPFAAVASETRISANRARGEKSHQGFFQKIKQIASVQSGVSGQKRISLAAEKDRKPR